jgi:predicted flap endonuclease-1-like 5' DNA nuclease
MKSQRGSKQGGVRSQDWRLQELPGLSDEQQEQLWNCGIHTTLQLYHQTNTPAKRAELARQLQIHPQYVSKWAAMADLARVPAIGCHYCGLLLHAGIASPEQLALMPIHRVHNKQILRFQVANLQRPDLCPSLEEIQSWIEQSQQLGRLDPRSLNRDTRTSP